MTTSTQVEVIRLADTLSGEELDALPVGLMLLDRDGTVLRYNRTEADLSRHAARDVLGRNFFRDVAPCTRVREFQGRFEEGVAARRLEVTFAFRFRFPDEREKDVTITMALRIETRTVWVMVERP